MQRVGRWYSYPFVATTATMKELSALEGALNVHFNNRDLLKQALVHRSYLNENPGFGLDHNERLEFLGDAVLELAVTNYLFAHFPDPEGELTNWRASLVNSHMLATVAQRLGVEDYLYLSRGEAKDTNSKARNYILANALEAIIGAIYLDQGFEAAEQLVSTFLIPELPAILEQKLYLDPKSRFQEIAQEQLKITPTYKVHSEVGPDHAKEFEIGVYLSDELIATGRGTSKQEAQLDAAFNGLKEKGWE